MGKKLLFLGGTKFIIPAIEAAKKLGYYVITCDYLPNNPAHRFSNEYYNRSTTDKESILILAKDLKVDGIISFATDSGAITSAYVQEQLGLPSIGPYESVCILQNKDRFRKFLSNNGFNVPDAKSFSTMQEALCGLSWYQYPVIVKPTDSAGSKGVTRVDNEKELKAALEYAFHFSISGRIIVEEFIEKRGCSSDSDCFSVEGELKYVSFNAQHFDENAAGPYVPAAYSYPSTMSMREEEELRIEIQRLLSLLNMGTTIYNIETRIGKNGKPYIMEVSPRGGGNRLAELIRFGTGVDLITNACRAAVGDPIIDLEQKPFVGHWAEVIIHSRESGVFDKLVIDNCYKSKVFQNDLWVKTGDCVNSFRGGNDAIGTLIMNFNTDLELEEAIGDINKWLKVVVR